MEECVENKNEDEILSFTENEINSDIDAFEQYINEYENKQKEESEDELSKLNTINDFEVFYSYDHNSLSLASSFCRNTLEKNEDFLEDKFNGDNLIDRFSEDKFIRCKYSEELHLNDFKSKYETILESEDENKNSDDFVNNENFVNNKNIVNNDEIVNSNENLNKDINENNEQIKIKKTEEESENEEIIELRKKHFLDFISTIPKVCTPSICGTMKKTILEKKKNENSFNEEENLFSDDNNDFGWSIDQLAALKPVEISFNEDKFLRFKDFELDEETQEKLSRENEEFFSQEKIAPSPKTGLVDNNNLSHNDLNKQLTPQCQTPLNKRKSSNTRKKSLFKNYFDRSEDYSNLEFSPKSINQTSTPCRSIKKLLFKD